MWGSPFLQPASRGVLGGQGAGPDLGGSQRGPDPGPPTMFMGLAIFTTCACHLVIFIGEESLFVDASILSVVQTAVFHLYVIW